MLALPNRLSLFIRSGIYYITYYTNGKRRGEILDLLWSDVDLSRRIVTVQSSPTFRTKAGRMRIVPLNEAALAVVRSRQVLSPSELVFTKNDAPVDEVWLTHAFKKAVIRARPPKTLHFHSLRHTFASWLVQRAGDVVRGADSTGSQFQSDD